MPWGSIISIHSCIGNAWFDSNVNTMASNSGLKWFFGLVDGWKHQPIFSNMLFSNIQLHRPTFGRVLNTVWFFWTQRKTAKMSYLYILQKGYRNWFRSIFPMLLGRQSTCLLHQSLHHGFGFQSSFLERNPKVVLDGKEIPWAATSVESPWVATTKTGKSWQILSHELRFGWFFSDWQWWQGWGENPAKREGTLWSVLAFLHQVLKLYLHLLEEATPSGRKDSDGKRFQWFQVSTLSGTFIAVFFFDTSSFICFCSACNNKYSQLLGQSYVCPP